MTLGPDGLKPTTALSAVLSLCGSPAVHGGEDVTVVGEKRVAICTPHPANSKGKRAAYVHFLDDDEEG